MHDRIPPAARLWQGLALVACAFFLAWIARFYHPGTGFTELIAFPAGEYKHPSLAALPHHETAFEYDGQFYAQLALEPLLRDPVIDRALDQPPYRARRILFSWTAWLAGFGRPAWVIQAYALQNVVCWLLLGWILTRWIPLRDGRMFALWMACMFSHGLLWSVRFALLDGPSMLLLACAVIAAESQRRGLLAAIVGVAGLGRETNLLGAAMLRRPRSKGEWLRTAGLLCLTILPLLIWQDYLFSIYRTTIFAGSNQVTWPVVPYAGAWKTGIDLIAHNGLWSHEALAFVAVLSVTVQAAFLLSERNYSNPWWRLALAFAALMLIVESEVWRGFPGAITRVLLPLTFGFNVLLAARRSAFWPWFVLGNLHLIAAVRVLR